MTTAQGGYTTAAKTGDPYKYQVGYGNRFASEALPDVLPYGQNTPQRNKYDLYPECINGTAFIAPRAQNQLVWLYRIFPSVAHPGYTKVATNPDIEANFSLDNPKIHVGPPQMLWKPFQLPSNKETVDFVDGLKTITGSGDPSSGEGIAIHIYTANASMGNKAFSNSDGDYLIVPQQGRLDIQTEVGKLMVEPGELVVIQRGHKFKIDLPDGPSRGYVEELFGSRFELPELGAIGANGLANPRDFQSPIAHFDIDQTPWEIIYKNCGKMFVCKQNHTPFDVVAWHGNYIPYKYDMRKFIHIGSISKDHIDPSVFTVLTAKSRTPGAPLAEFCVITARWDVASESFRPPFYHRNCAVEMLGVVYDDPAQPAMKPFEAGGFYYQTNMAPHGPAWEDFKAASEMKLEPMRIHEHSMLILFESNRMLNLTDYAVNRSATRAAFTTERFEALQPQFMKHIGEITATLKAKGLPPLDLSRAKL